jgi:RNA polymerase sigma-70 factor (ECF subfamily)
MASQEALLEGLRVGSQEAFKSAFEAHGRMVYNVCLRVTGNAATADDATQAAFLLLFHKRMELGKGTVLASWLYRAGEFSARKAVRSEGRRRQHEKESTEMVQKNETRYSDEQWQAIRPELDAAVAELPEKLRSAVVLTYIEGVSGQKAAEILGVPHGTVKSRLSLAMEKLRSKLRHIAPGLAAAGIAEILAQKGAEAAVPQSTLASTIAAVKSSAAGGAAAAEGANTILEAVTKMIYWNKIQVAGVVVATVLVTAGVSIPAAVHVKRTYMEPDAASMAADQKPAEKGAAGANVSEGNARGAMEDAGMNDDMTDLLRSIELSRMTVKDLEDQLAKAGGAARTSKEEIEELLKKIDWEPFVKFQADWAYNGSPECMESLSRQMPTVLRLMSLMGLKSWHELCAHELAHKYFIPAMAKAQGQEMSDSDKERLFKLIDETFEKRDAVCSGELAAWEFALLRQEYAKRAKELCSARMQGYGPSPLELAPAAQITVDECSYPLIRFMGTDAEQADGMQLPEVKQFMQEQPREIAKLWRDRYGIDPNQIPVLERIAGFLVDSMERNSGLPLDDRRISAARDSLQAARMIVQNVVLTPEQRRSVENQAVSFSPIE